MVAWTSRQSAVFVSACGRPVEVMVIAPQSGFVGVAQAPAVGGVICTLYS